MRRPPSATTPRSAPPNSPGRLGWRSAALGTAVALVLSLPPTAAEPNGTDPLETYRRLAEAAPDGRTIALGEEVTLVRDAFKLRFANGRFHLLEEVEGRTPGAVFIGSGTVTLTPATEAERRHMAFRTGDAGLQTLSDSFAAAVLLFDDDTAEELAALGEVVAGPPDRDAAATWEKTLPRPGNDPLLRLLRHRWNDEGSSQGPFYAFFEGENLGEMVLGVDPMGILDGEGACLEVTSGRDPGYWYSSTLAGARAEGRDGRPMPVADARHYEVRTRIGSDVALEAETEIELEVVAPSLRVLPFSLAPSLRITEASLAGEAAAPLGVLQRASGEAALIFPEAFAAGTRLRVRLVYGGDGVLDEDGVGIYTVGSRTSWYPNLGPLHDRATYDLTFRVPGEATVVAVGEEVETRTDGGETVSRWRSERPLTVAGFNYGEFRRYDRLEKNTGTAVEIYASTGTPDVIEEINRYLQDASGGLNPLDAAALARDDSVISVVNTYSGPSSVGVSPSALADIAMADALNTVQVLSNYFGPLDEKRLAITQQSQWTFGQAWPSLVYLPYLVGLSDILQRDLGLDGYAGFYDQVGIHEIAHQWWGHRVGWARYRDQWLSEGFAEFSTALVVELTDGREAYTDFWKQRRTAILGTPVHGGSPAYAAGPITLGQRVSTARSPGAYSALAYSKGAYVLHMLRMMMREPGSERPDARFFAMMQDFASSFAGRDATTEDFKAVVQRHMIPELNARGDGRIDWFFEQWVYGTAVPIYEADLQVEKAGRGKYRLVGSVSQSGVPDGFVTLVGIYVDLGKDRIGQLGRLPLKGTASRKVDVTVELPNRPKRALINAFEEVLAFGST